MYRITICSDLQLSHLDGQGVNLFCHFHWSFFFNLSSKGDVTRSLYIDFESRGSFHAVQIDDLNYVHIPRNDFDFFTLHGNVHDAWLTHFSSLIECRFYLSSFVLI